MDQGNDVTDSGFSFNPCRLSRFINTTNQKLCLSYFTAGPYYEVGRIDMFRQAEIKDAAALTKLSFASKNHWEYPPGFFDIWAKELTVTPTYIKNNDVQVYMIGDLIEAYYSIVELDSDIEMSGVLLKKGYWLDHMFVAPQNIGKGIGSELFGHLKKRCFERGITELGILADPNAKGFYLKMGCVYLKEYPSTIKNRTTPYLKLDLAKIKSTCPD